MAESWKDRTVSLGNVDKEEFDSDLAHITVSENRVSVEFRQVEDWKRIKREIGEESILKRVPWEDVEGLEKNVEHLYYPHIDVETSEGEKRLYFHEDEAEKLQRCFNAIKRFWNLYRESGPRSRGADSYSYEEEAGGDEEVEEKGGEVQEEVEVEDPEAEEDDEGPDEEEVEELVDELMDR